ncbi:MAG: MFS transporter [Thermoplasmata archaeon]|nr:MFS transporter [Thermoplasmata archaeon]
MNPTTSMKNQKKNWTKEGTVTDKRERWFLSYLPTSMAGSCYDALLPIFIVIILGGDIGQVALISVIASATTVPSLIFWGFATDSQKHRKSFIVIGYMGRALAYIIMGASTGISEMAFAHIIIGLFASASAPAISILIFENFSRNKWCEKIGKFNTVAGVGNILGLILGIIWIALMPSFLGFETALRVLFILNAILAILGAWLAYVLIVELPNKIPRGEHIYDPMLELARWSRERARYLPGRIYHFFKPSHLKILGKMHKEKKDSTGRFLISTFIYNSGIHSFLTIMPVWILLSLGLDGIGLFALSLVLIISSTIAYSPIGKKLDKSNKSKMLSYSILVRTVVVMLCAFLLTFLAFGQGVLISFLIIIYAVLGVTWAIIADTQLPLFSNIRSGNNQGAKTGVFNAVVGCGHIAGDAAGGILALTLGFPFAIIVSAGLIAVSSGIYMTIKSQKTTTAGPKPFEYVS